MIRCPYCGESHEVMNDLPIAYFLCSHFFCPMFIETPPGGVTYTVAALAAEDEADTAALVAMGFSYVTEEP